MQNWSHSQSEGRSWHQVSDYAFMSLSSIDLSELFFIVNFHSNAVLEDILYVLFLSNFLPIFLCIDNLLEVLRVTPCYLYSS